MAHPEREDTRLHQILQASCEVGTDPILSLLRHTIQQVPEEELTAFLNAEPYTRTGERPATGTGTSRGC